MRVESCRGSFPSAVEMDDKEIKERISLERAITSPQTNKDSDGYIHSIYRMKNQLPRIYPLPPLKELIQVSFRENFLRRPSVVQRRNTNINCREEKESTDSIARPRIEGLVFFFRPNFEPSPSPSPPDTRLQDFENGIDNRTRETIIIAIVDGACY